MPSMTAGRTQTAAAQEDQLRPHSSLQLALIAQFAPVAIVKISSTTCTTAHFPIAAATSLCATSGLGTPTTSLGLLALTTASAMPILASHLRRKTTHCRTSLRRSTLTRHVEVPILGRE